MSEPTGEGPQQPDPDEDQVQDHASGSDFNDPTAPVWADPTAPIPAPPAPPVPPGAASPYGQQPAAPQATPPPPPPVSNPYAQQPPVQPYGQPAPYAQPSQYGQQYPTYGQQSYATGAPTAPSNTSAIVLTIVSGLTTLTTCVIGIPSLIFGIMALTSNSTDPVGSRKKSRTGWIIFAVNAGLIVLAVVAIVAIVIANSDGGSSNFNSGF